MQSTRARLSAPLTVAGSLLLLSCLACKCGDRGSDQAVATPEASGSATDQAPGDADIAVRLQKKLHDAACSSKTSPHRVWCLADGYASASHGDLPSGDAALVGITIGLSDDFPAEQSLTNNVTFSALGLSRSGSATKGWISTVRPNSPTEQTDVGEAVFNVAKLYKGGAASVALAPPLFNYVRSLPGKAKYPVVRGKKGWVIESSAMADVRRVGPYWVSVELPAARPMKGIYLSIFTDKYASK